MQVRASFLLVDAYTLFFNLTIDLEFFVVNQRHSSQTMDEAVMFACKYVIGIKAINRKNKLNFCMTILSN